MNFIKRIIECNKELKEIKIQKKISKESEFKVDSDYLLYLEIDRDLDLILESNFEEMEDTNSIKIEFPIGTFSYIDNYLKVRGYTLMQLSETEGVVYCD